MILFHIHDGRSRPPVHRAIGRSWTAVALPFEDLGGVAASTMRNCLVDVDVTKLSTALKVRTFFRRAPTDGLRIFACRRGHRHAAIQSSALGATGLVDLPLRDEAIAALLPEWEPVPKDDMPGSAVIATVALDAAFRSMEGGSELQATGLRTVAHELARDISRIGLEGWLQPIRQHHAGVYQHCLTVMGLATAFGQALGLPGGDLSDLTVAALLHDIGKAKLGAELLDKPGKLTEAERALLAQHPVWGYDHLAAHSDVSPRVLDVVRHHHELLDGSGYPDGLAGAQIGDLTRLVTITDIFSALVERRSYKPPMPPDAAFGVLRHMAEYGRIEGPLVEAFGPVARRVMAPAA